VNGKYRRGVGKVGAFAGFVVVGFGKVVRAKSTVEKS